MIWLWLVCPFVLWLVVSSTYVSELRAILAAREKRVFADLEGVSAKAGPWTAVLSTASRRDWRRSLEALQRVLETLKSSAPLEARVAAASQIRSFLEQAARWVTQDPTAFSADIHGVTEELRRALDRAQTGVDEYRAAAADAAFAGRRFPLSLIAWMMAK